jgi:hypothetical protein
MYIYILIVRNYILFFIQVEKKITTSQSKIMHTINSTTEFAGKITIWVLNKTIEDRTQHVVLIYIKISVGILKKKRLARNYN